MRISSLVIPMITHGAKFGSSSPSGLGRNSDPFNLISLREGGKSHVDHRDEIVLPNKDVARSLAQGSLATPSEHSPKPSIPVLPQVLNRQQRNANQPVEAERRKMQSSDWTQIGLDIYGEAAGDWSGWSVSLSGNGSVLAVGAMWNDPSTSRTDAGHVRVYKFNGIGWTQLGLDIDGEAAGDASGYRVSLSSDGSVLAVGARLNDPSSARTDAGHVRVYNYSGTVWTQLGLDIDGEVAHDWSGQSVCLSSDGSVLAVGARYNDPSSGRIDAGHVRVYKFNGIGWTQLGLDIDGEAAGDESGWSGSLSRDGSVLAVGAWWNDPSSGRIDAGHVRVYKFNDTHWTQLGLDIDGEAAGDYSGYSVSLSSDGSVLAVGARCNDPSSDRPDAGHVRVYKFNGTVWTQLGLDIDGEADYDLSGNIVSLSSDGSVLAVGARLNDPSTGRIDAGHVRVYKYNGTVWTQRGLDIDGDAAGDSSGWSVSLSSDGSVLAVGAPFSDQSGRTDAGHVRVYQNDLLSMNNSPSSTPSKSPLVLPTLSPSKPPSNALSSSPTTPPSSRLDNFREKSIESTCIVNSDIFLLECSARTDVLVAGVFKTSLVQGTCTASNPPTEEIPVSSIDLDVNVNCKNNGICNHTHCFRADFVVEGVSVIAEMWQVVSAISFENDGTFSVAVETSNFTVISEKTNTTVVANVTVTLGECGSTSTTGEALQIGDTAVVCISSPENVKLSLKSVTANPGKQVLVNEVGDPNFLTTFNDNANSVTLRTLMIPVYFDAQEGDSGSIVIAGTAEIIYDARHLVSGPRYLGEVEEALFGLEVPLVHRVKDVEVTEMSAEVGNFGCIAGWNKFITLVILGAVFVML